jgi:hypothetical protein
MPEAARVLVACLGEVDGVPFEFGLLDPGAGWSCISHEQRPRAFHNARRAFVGGVRRA